jgi:hypothetical protein
MSTTFLMGAMTVFVIAVVPPETRAVAVVVGAVTHEVVV